jgi:flagellar protein FliS
MPSYVQDAYLESEILQADGCRLVQMLYRSAIEAIAKARVHLRSNEIRERSREITKAQEIVNELAQSLDHSAGGSISRNLAELYAYLQQLLIEANFKQVETPLAEAGALLETLLEAWERCNSATLAAPSYGASTWDASYEHVPVDCVG